MKSSILLFTLYLCLIATNSYSSGFYLPNQSASAIALSGAHIAYTPGADCSYCNPANMSWRKDAFQVEAGQTTIVLPSIGYRDSISSLYNGDSATETIVSPQLSMTSGGHKDLHFGFSLTNPFGLSYLYHHTKSRAVVNVDSYGQPNISGVFSGGGAHLIHTGFFYEF